MVRAKFWAEKRAPFELAGQKIAAGTVETIDVPVSLLSNHAAVSMPVRVFHGSKPGPVLFISAAVHGDEIIGVEIIRRVIQNVSIKRLRGTLLCIPVVNAYGFIARQRYLPDRRDLNRVFPGSARGSLAAQLAHMFTTEIIARSDYGIDLHSAGLHRENLPQIRISEGRPKATELADVFGAPAVLVSKLRDGSLRQTAADNNCDVLLMESGEALRFDEFAIRIGTRGILRVMEHLDMGVRKQSTRAAKSVHSDRTRWVRAEEGGLFRSTRKIGQFVEKGEVMGYVSDPFGDIDLPVEAPVKGIIIGRTNLPVVNMGDALVHVAEVVRPDTADERLTQIEEAAFEDELFDEDEII
ncbi:succinylglutamate desuccinylase/aspartoacylase family protein [Altererythrobacter sp. ZODW24]|uniref:succinylglutamate desuccinylase/aspartoacylase family protein n=1 Tax=Altererythrobacter sp. ZODW24 TaxID=2185142 RepID=UPI000DF78D88|nr:succinylglutamate desuccinylase/aspartoacylase family protein [Altererythrobacter sp. ZODW24]